MVTVSPLPILRLIERMVRSGARTHWLRAVRPTSTSPVGDTPTTDGSRRSPATGHICMVPFWMTPSTELVVPRSIPIILLVSLMTGLLWRSLERRLGGPPRAPPRLRRSATRAAADDSPDGARGRPYSAPHRLGSRPGERRADGDRREHGGPESRQYRRQSIRPGNDH